MPGLSVPLCDKQSPGDFSSRGSKKKKDQKVKKKNNNNKLLGEFLSEAAPPLRFLPSISESFPAVSPGNRSTFFKLAFKGGVGEVEKGAKEEEEEA